MMENAAFVTEPASEQITPEKLREIANDWSHRSGELRNVIYTAADWIEALETQLKSLQSKPYHYIGRDGKTVLASDLEDRVHELRATNAKLLAALEWLCVDAKITGLDQQAGWDCAFIAARAAIAAAEGGGE